MPMLKTVTHSEVSSCAGRTPGVTGHDCWRLLPKHGTYGMARLRVKLKFDEFWGSPLLVDRVVGQVHHPANPTAEASDGRVKFLLLIGALISWAVSRLVA